MNKNIIISALFGVATVFTSCNGFLDIKPYDRTIPETAEDFSALVHEMIQEIDEYGSSSVGAMDLVGSSNDAMNYECCVDNLETNLTEYPLGSSLNYYVGPYAAKGSNYSHFYAVISRCNIIMENMEEDRDTQEGKDILGTAYAMRGVAYYQLLRFYCPPVGSDDEQLGVPIVTEFDMEAKPGRGTIEETIAQAESDLKQALTYGIQNELYRFSDDVIKGYLARLYFWAGRYEEAKDMALELLESHPLLQGDEYTEMMSANDGLAGNMLIRGDRLTNSFSTKNYYLVARPLSVRYVKLFTEKEDDIRYSLFFNSKRENKKIFFSGMRSAEFAFIAMESYYHLGQTTEALAMLNDFRSHRISNYVPYTMSTLPAVETTDYIKEDAQGNALTPLIYAILAERRKELYLENDRFFELKRNGRPEFWVVRNGLKYYTRQYMYTYAIPPKDIQLNPALVQNPGYDEMVFD